MKSHNIKSCVKYRLFVILLISLIGTANAATGQPGGIALSWDDVLSVDSCHQNLQLFDTYNATCTININSNDLDVFGQGTKNNLSELHSAGWEVAVHGHNHQDSVAFLKNYSSTVWLNQEIISNIQVLNDLGYPVYSFAYPFGERNETTDALLAQYFRTIRSSEFETMNDRQAVKDTSNAYYKWDDTQVLYAVEIDDNSGVSLESIKAGIDYAIENEYVLLLYGHVITSGTPADYQTSTSKLEEILKYTQEKNGTFYHMGDLGNSSWVPYTSSNMTGNVTANFTVSKDTVVVGENVTFVDYSINQTSELLDFGDGSNSTTANVTHVYTTPGTYTATLTVRNDAYTRSMIKTIIVTTGHTGGIALSWDDVQNVGPCYENLEMFKGYNANCTINLNNLSQWGQGTTDNLTNLQNEGWEIAAHGYSHLDSVNFLNSHTSQELLNQEIFPNIVELKGYDYPAYSFAYPDGSRDNNTDALLAPYFKTIRAVAFGADNINHTGAYYRWDDTQVLYAVEIDDQSGISMESIQYGIDEAIKYGYVLVLYGHKITPTVNGPYQTSTERLDSILNYTSQKGGKFYLMKDLGDSSWEQRSPRFSNVTANFTVSKDTVVVGENVTFVDYSVNQTSELLDFGDDSNSTTANVIHKYTTPGTYTANLTVSNDVSIRSISRTINVTAAPIAPVANFTFNPTTGPAPLNVAFTDTSSGGPATWSWKFGDSSTSDVQSPTHTYSAAGNYTVNLTVSNTNGTNSKTAIIAVLQGPVANFNVSATNGYAPLSVTFTDLSKNATSRLWEFGDGKNSTEQNPTYIYLAAGTYIVKLTASNVNGTDSKTAVITVQGNESIHPEADFTASPTSGDKPLTVVFTDTSKNSISRSWDVNGDGVEDSNEASFAYTYYTKGTYAAILTAINSNGTDTKTINIDVKGGGSNHGGGGGGGSPEPAKNVEVKELSQVFVTNDKAAKFDLTKNATCVVYVGFNSKKTAGKTTTTVEQLKNKSTLVSGLPEGEVYKYFNVWVGNSGFASSENIENPTICFKIEKSWVKDKKIDKDSITLNRYSDKKWEKLPAKLLREDNKYLYFESSVPGYSFFAITGKTTENEINQPTEVITPKPETQENEQNNTGSEVNQTSVKRTRTPGFEAIYCIIGLFGVFLYRRR